MIVLDNGDIKFTSAHDALVFAFNVSNQAYDRPMMNRLAAPSLGKGGLTGLEAPAQAGMVRAEVKALGKFAEAILVASVAPRSTPCECRSSCCSGQKANKEWIDAISVLADNVRTTALAGCVSNGLMRREYVVRFFTKREDRISLEALADKYEIDRHTVSAHSSKVAAYFAGQAGKKGRPSVPGYLQLALDAIDDRLRSIGMVG